MARRRGEVGKRRREQVVSAAVAVIAEEGLQNLSLSAIEEKAGMSRGQLTYYFPTKEAILLAVFDHLIEMMHRQESGKVSPPCGAAGAAGWPQLRALLTWLILEAPESPEFHALQYTFLSQIGHRDDFRQALASLYEHWRGLGAADFAAELPAPPGRPDVSPRTLASFLQAVLHGLAVQRVADPQAFDRQEMLTLSLHLFAGYLGKTEPPRTKNPAKARPRKRRKA
jgi:AcrR family transcriptional regulator